MIDFATFYAAYPRKQARKDAEKAWLQTASVRPPLEGLLAALAKAKKSAQWQGGYIPLAATFLRGERWTDEYELDLPQAQDTSSAWQTFRESIRDAKHPSDPILSSVINKFGGLSQLGNRTSFDIQNMRKDFDAAYKRTASH